MLDEDLAELYGVETKRLMQQVRRNKERFPDDFMVQLTQEEFETLRSQIATSKEGPGGRRYRPYVFTEQGVAMLSSVLRSKQATAVNIEIMRAFVELRRIAQSHTELSKRIDELEREVKAGLGAQETKVAAIFEMLRQVTISKKRPRPAGFMPPGEGD
ncbi:MAG: ORF6N domain-containing protein [Solirubrobacterales bacterium]